jgi:hypothetical protein
LLAAVQNDAPGFATPPHLVVSNSQQRVIVVKQEAALLGQMMFVGLDFNLYPAGQALATLQVAFAVQHVVAAPAVAITVPAFVVSQYVFPVQVTGVSPPHLVASSSQQLALHAVASVADVEQYPT